MDSEGNNVGDVRMTIMGNEVIVSIIAAPGYTLNEASIFVGTQGVPLDGSGAANLSAFPFSIHSLSSSNVTYTTTVWLVHRTLRLKFITSAPTFVNYHFFCMFCIATPFNGFHAPSEW